MSETNFNKLSGSSRDMSVTDKSFEQVVWRQGSPILDSELNLMSQISNEKLKKLLSSQVPSGFFIDSLNAKAGFKPTTALNTVVLAPTTVNIRGKLLDIPEDVSVTLDSTTTSVKDYLVYLVVWESILKPTTATTGNVQNPTVNKYGYTSGTATVPGELIDPALNIETSHRVQLKYGFFVSDALDLSQITLKLENKTFISKFSRDGDIWKLDFDAIKNSTPPPSQAILADIESNITALNLASPVIYALPVCKVTRRNSSPYSEPSSGNSNSNLEGDSNRPDGKSAGVIYPEDIKDLRPAVQIGSVNLEDTLKRNLVHLLHGLKSSRSPVRADAFGAIDTSSPANALDTFTSGRSVFSDSVHTQTYDFLFKFKSASAIEAVNSSTSATTDLYLPTEAGFGGTVTAFSAGYTASTPHGFNKKSFIKFPLANIKPTNGKFVYSGKPAVSMSLDGSASSQISVATHLVQSYSVGSTAYDSATKVFTLDANSQSLDGVDATFCFALIEGDIPGIAGSAGVSAITVDTTTTKKITLLDTLTGSMTASSNFTLKIYSKKDYLPGDTDCVIYNLSTNATNTSVANTQLDFLIYDSPAFSKPVKKHHYLKLSGSFDGLAQAADSNTIRTFTPRPLADKVKYTSQLYSEPASKTIVFQPYQFNKVSLTQTTATSLASTDFPLGAKFKVSGSGSYNATAATNSFITFQLPKFLQQPAGWFDIPVVPEGSTSHAFGLHYLFEDKGGDIGSTNPFILPSPVYFKVSTTATDLGKSATNIWGGSSNVDGYTAYWDAAKPEYIKFPANIGIARLMGIYTTDEGVSSIYNTDRKTRFPGSPSSTRNKLNFSKSQETIYRDGDYFFVPTSLITGWDSSKADKYIFECMVFGFAPTAATNGALSKVFLQTDVAPSVITNSFFSEAPVAFFGAPPLLKSGDTCVNVYSEKTYAGTLDAAGISTTLGTITTFTATPEYYQVLASKTFVTSLGTGKVAGVASMIPGIKSNIYGDTASLPTTPSMDYLSALVTGLTCNLPLGVLADDSLFQAEPLAHGPLEIMDPPIFLGEQSEIAPPVMPGMLIGVLPTQNNNNEFKVRRGKGSAFVLNPESKPLPLVWYAGSLESAQLPKAGVLSGAAYLVRNSQNELKLLVATYAHYAPSSKLELVGMISPSGHGHGYAAVDVFDLEDNAIYNGKPFPAPTGVNLNSLPKP